MCLARQAFRQEIRPNCKTCVNEISKSAHCDRSRRRLANGYRGPSKPWRGPTIGISRSSGRPLPEPRNRYMATDHRCPTSRNSRGFSGRVAPRRRSPVFDVPRDPAHTSQRLPVEILRSPRCRTSSTTTKVLTRSESGSILNVMASFRYLLPPRGSSLHQRASRIQSRVSAKLRVSDRWNVGSRVWYNRG